MAKIALEVEKLNDKLKHDDFLGKGTITTSLFESGSPSQCAVADYAKIQLDRRLTWGETKESAVTELEECCKLAGVEDAKVSVLQYDAIAYTGKEYSVEKYFPTWKLDPKSPWLTNAEKSYNETLGITPKIDKWTFSTNCVFIMANCLFNSSDTLINVSISSRDQSSRVIKCFPLNSVFIFTNFSYYIFYLLFISATKPA